MAAKASGSESVNGCMMACIDKSRERKMKVGGGGHCNNQPLMGMAKVGGGWQQESLVACSAVKRELTIANNDETTNHRREWQRRAAAGNKSTYWRQRGGEGIDNCTMADNDKSRRLTAMQQLTIVGRGRGGRQLVTIPPEGSGQ